MNDDFKLYKSVTNYKGKERLNAILNVSNPTSFIQKMSVLDVLDSINEIGFEDSLEIIELLSPKQVQNIIDLDCWQKDRLSLSKIATYFNLLLQANKNTSFWQILSQDIELLGLLIKIVANIYDTSLEEEPLEYNEEYLITPCRRFIVNFHNDKKFAVLTTIIKQLLEELFAHDLSLALSMLNQVKYELVSTLEETCYKFKEARLQDLGILPKEERLSIVAALNKDIKPTNTKDSSPNNKSYSIENKEIIKSSDYLQKALVSCDAPFLKLKSDEIKFISLNVHAELFGDFSSFSKLKTTGEYVKNMVSLALFLHSQGLPHDAHNFLVKYSVKDLFRFGRTQILKLKKIATDLAAQTNLNLDEPLKSFISAITLKEPLFYEGLINIDAKKARLFKDNDEILNSLWALSEIKFRAELLASSEFTKEENKKNTQSEIWAIHLLKSFIGEEITIENIKNIFDNNLSEGSVNKLNKKFVDHCYVQGKRLVEKVYGHDSEKFLRANSFTDAVLVKIESNIWSII